MGRAVGRKNNIGSAGRRHGMNEQAYQGEIERQRRSFRLARETGKGAAGSRPSRLHHLRIEIKGSLGDLFRNQFRNALDGDVGTSRPRAFSNGIGHGFDMAVGRVIKERELSPSSIFLETPGEFRNRRISTSAQGEGSPARGNSVFNVRRRKFACGSDLARK